MEGQLQSTELFGGAMSAPLPKGFIDASNIRPVPNTQEVFLNMANTNYNEKDSYIIDILEMVEAPNDKEAIDAHLEEISRIDSPLKKSNTPQENWKLLHHELVDCDYSQTCKGYLGICYSELGDGQAKLMLIGLIRDIKNTADILITMSLPEEISKNDFNLLESLKGSSNEESMSSSVIVKRLQFCKDSVIHILKHFRLVDENLFG